MSFLGESLAILTAVSWAVSSLIFEKVSKQMNPQVANFLRVTIGTIMIGFVCLFTERHMFLPFDVPTKDLKIIFLSGFIGMFIGDLFLFKAYINIGARVTMVIMTLSPIVVSIIDFIFLGVTLSYLQIFAIFITCTGVLIVILNPTKKKNKNQHLPLSIKGLIFAFLATLGQSLGVILTKLGSSSYDSLGTSQIRLFSAIICFGIFILIEKKGSEVITTLKNIKTFSFVSAGTFFSVFGIAALVEAFKHTNASIASTLSSTSPILMIPISIFFFKEKVKFSEIIGVVISIIGISIFFL